METRYCIEYVNPKCPFYDNGQVNVRHDRVLTLDQAEHDLTLILSFGAKILNLYIGNVIDGKTGEWNPKPSIVDDDDWATPQWLNSLKNKKINEKKELIIHWFEHIAQLADDKKTANGDVMEDWAALDEIKALAKDSVYYIQKHC